MSLPLDTIIQGDALEVMKSFPADSIDCVITSTPYWGLRSYQGTEKIWGGKLDCQHIWNEVDSPTHKQGGEGIQSTNRGTLREDTKTNFCSLCGAWKGQLGLEPLPSMFIEHLVEIFREVRRILKPSGTVWLNLGDTFFGSGGGNHPSQNSIDSRKEKGVHTVAFTQGIAHTKWLQPKQKLMIPARVAIAMQDDGWILRNEIIWAKPNPMPESVKDRLTETWESVFLFVKNRRYWFDLDSIRLPHAGTSVVRTKFAIRKDETYGVNTNQRRESEGWSPQNLQEREGRKSISQTLSPLGKNPGDVWTITTHSFSGAHFATFPEKLIEPMISAGCPEWICKKCELPRVRISKAIVGNSRVDKLEGIGKTFGGTNANRPREVIHNPSFETIGWTDCDCKEGFRAGVVLDPFCGSGTTCLVAKKLNRNYIGIDLNLDYVEMARKRIDDETCKKWEYPTIFKVTKPDEKQTKLEDCS